MDRVLCAFLSVFALDTATPVQKLVYTYGGRRFRAHVCRPMVQLDYDFRLCHPNYDAARTELPCTERWAAEHGWRVTLTPAYKQHRWTVQFRSRVDDHVVWFIQCRPGFEVHTASGAGEADAKADACAHADTNTDGVSTSQ